MYSEDIQKALMNNGWIQPNPTKWFVYRKGQFTCHILGHPVGKPDECIASILDEDCEFFCHVIQSEAYLKIQLALIEAVL